MRLLSRWFRRVNPPELHFRCAVCDELQAFVRDKDLAGLIDVLKTDRRHAAEAAECLTYLTGRGFGTDAAAWKSWVRKQRGRLGMGLS